MPKNIHINFTGASSTGKTTVLESLHKVLPEFKVNTGVIRHMTGMSLNESSTEESQTAIFDAYNRFLEENQSSDYISDRCIIDPLAYTLVLTAQGRLDRAVLNNQWSAVKRAVEELKLTHVFYFPIEFGSVSDGVRSEDEDFRRETDCGIRAVLNDLKRMYPQFDYTEVHGTPEERQKLIIDYIIK